MDANKNLDTTVRYSKEHEWVRPEGNDIYLCGISDFAQAELGDIVFVELEPEGTIVSQGNQFGTIESVKVASELFIPMSGEIIEINDALDDQPEIINEDCYGEGWIIKFKATNSSEWDTLLESKAYGEFTEAE